MCAPWPHGVDTHIDLAARWPSVVSPYYRRDAVAEFGSAGKNAGETGGSSAAEFLLSFNWDASSNDPASFADVPAAARMRPGRPIGRITTSRAVSRAPCTAGLSASGAGSAPRPVRSAGPAAACEVGSIAHAHGVGRPEARAFARRALLCPPYRTPAERAVVVHCIDLLECRRVVRLSRRAGMRKDAY